MAENDKAIVFDESQFLELGLKTAGFKKWQTYKHHTNIRRFKKAYSAVLRTAADMWEALRTEPPDSLAHIGIEAKPIHLLIALRWAFKYDTEDDLGNFFGVTAKTAAKWSKYIAKRAAILQEKRMGSLDDNNKGLRFLMTIDGTCCPIWEPKPFSKDNACFKFGMKPGVNYELGVSLYEPKLIWINGPMQPGVKTNLMVFQEKLKAELPVGTKAIADGIYVSEPEHVSTKNDLDSKEVRKFKNRALARHENFNQRLKCYKILSEKYRHGRKVKNQPEIPHGIAFRFVCCIVSFQLENGATRLLDPYP